MKIRALNQRDIPELLRLRQALWPDCTAARHNVEIREMLSDAARFVVIVLERKRGTLAGFAEVSLRDGVDGAKQRITAYLEGWYVESEWRGSGWGRKLVAAGQRWARQKGMVELASDAELTNADAIAAHRAVGFRETFRVVQFLKKVPRRKTP